MRQTIIFLRKKVEAASSFFKEIPGTGQITVFIMIPVSVTYSAFVGNVTLVVIHPDIDC